MGIQEQGFNVRVVQRLTSLTHRQLVHWDNTALIHPSIRSAAGRGSRRIYSFEDLVELRVVAALREKGVSLQAVRRAVKHLRQHHDELKRPLANLMLFTDGQRILALTDKAQRLIELTAGGQVVFAVPVAGIVRSLRDKVTELGAAVDLDVRAAGRKYRVRLTPDLEDGGYVAEVPELPGCISQGDTIREARSMVREAIEAWLGAGVRADRASR